MKKLTLANVESLIPLLDDNIVLRSRAPTIVEMAVPWRRRSRIRRILSELRRIRRSQPHLQFEYCRQTHLIYLRFNNDQHWTLFQLMWPTDCTPWDPITDLDWPTSP